MNRSELATAVAEREGVPRTKAERILNAALEVVSTELARGGRVTLTGFGSFRVVLRQARTGRDPRTGTPIPIHPYTSVSFVLSEELKTALNSRLSAS